LSAAATGQVLGLITARGGSKSVPRKNLVPVGGKPLIAWTIESALKSQRLDRVIVSTDDMEIARVAAEWGAEVPFMRPKELAEDDSPHIDVVIHAVQWLEEHERWSAEYVVLLQPTSPLRTAADIDGAIEMAKEKEAVAVIGVVETHAHPYLTRKMTEHGVLEDFIPTEIPYLYRQGLPPAYFINGAVFVNRRDSLLKKRTFYPSGMYGYVMPAERSLQIDSPWDLYLADLITRDRISKESVAKR